MKTGSICFLAVAVFAMSIPVGLAASPTDYGTVTDPTAAAFIPFRLNLRPGSSPDEARQALGAPDATLGDLWIYWHFAANPNRDDPEFDTLVIAFTADRVTAVKITDGRVVRQLLAQAARNAKSRAVAQPPARR